jgi:Ca2+-binding RTX toxin-like protein
MIHTSCQSSRYLFTIEALDARLYLTAAVVGNNLRIELNDADNIVRVAQSANHFAVKIDGKTTTFARNGIKQIVVYGNDGKDRIDLRGVTLRALIHGDEGADIILSGKGRDRLFGEGNADVIKGGPGNDTIDGGAGEDTIFGNSGDDFLNGRDDEYTSDFLDGGPGEDRAKIFFFSRGENDELENVEDISYS